MTNAGRQCHCVMSCGGPRGFTLLCGVMGGLHRGCKGLCLNGNIFKEEVHPSPPPLPFQVVV